MSQHIDICIYIFYKTIDNFKSFNLKAIQIRISFQETQPLIFIRCYIRLDGFIAAIYIFFINRIYLTDGFKNIIARWSACQFIVFFPGNLWLFNLIGINDTTFIFYLSFFFVVTKNGKYLSIKYAKAYDMPKLITMNSIQ